MWIADKWNDYELLDCGGGEKLERWDKQFLVRPDPQAIWETPHQNPAWKKANARYLRSQTGGGHWEKKTLPESWKVHYGDLTFQVKPMNFKHTGLFPEQAVNWDFMRSMVERHEKPFRVLNLFAYTGGATCALAAAGAEVVHVDAAKGMVSWAKENMVLNHLEDHTIRFIVDDAIKFVQREQRRGNRYDIIIMDPPSYGRGPNNELWKLEDQLENLIAETSKLLSDQPIAYLVNGYTTGFSPIVLSNIMSQYLLKKHPDGKVYTVELAIPTSDRNIILPCGISGRFEL